MEGTIYNIDDFIDDNRLFTKTQNEMYKNDDFKGFKGNVKRSIEKKFLAYYESFEWVRKKKNMPYQIKVGIPNKEVVITDGRMSENHRLLLPLFKNTAYVLSILKKNDDKYDVDYSPVRWMNEMRSTNNNKLFNMEFYNIREKVDDENKDDIAQYYFRQRKLILRNEFKFLESHFKFYKQIKKYNARESSVMTHDEELKYLKFESELANKYDKPTMFRKRTESQSEYAKEMKQFLKDNYGCETIYYVYSVDLESSDYADPVDCDFDGYKQSLKNKMDKSIIDRQIKEYKKNKIYHFLADLGYAIPDDLLFPKYKYVKSMIKLKAFDKFKEFDKTYGFGETQSEIEDYYKSQLESVQIGLSQEEWVFEEYRKLHKQPIENLFKNI